MHVGSARADHALIPRGARGADDDVRDPGARSGGEGVEQTLDCNDSTLFVNGINNIVNALGSCWAVTVMGSGNTVVADTVINDITIYGSNETVYFRNGDPFIWDRGRQLGMVNRIDRVAA